MVALSTAESKYIALTEAVKEAMWLHGIVDKFEIKVSCVPIYYNNYYMHIQKSHVP